MGMPTLPAPKISIFVIFKEKMVRKLESGISSSLRILTFGSLSEQAEFLQMHLPEIAVFTSILLLCHCFAGAFQESLMGHLLREVIQNPIEALIQFLKCNFIITSVQETHQGGAVFPQMDRCGVAQLHLLRLPFPHPLVLNILAETMASWEMFENFRTNVSLISSAKHCVLIHHSAHIVTVHLFTLSVNIVFPRIPL